MFEGLRADVSKAVKRAEEETKSVNAGRPGDPYDGMGIGGASTGATQGQCSRPASDLEMLEQIFTYHPARPDQMPHYINVRMAARHFAEVILANVPPCADRTATIRKIREAVMTANAAIALDGRSIG